MTSLRGALRRSNLCIWVFVDFIFRCLMPSISIKLIYCFLAVSLKTTAPEVFNSVTIQIAHHAGKQSSVGNNHDSAIRVGFLKGLNHGLNKFLCAFADRLKSFSTLRRLVAARFCEKIFSRVVCVNPVIIRKSFQSAKTALVCNYIINNYNKTSFSQ